MYIFIHKKGKETEYLLLLYVNIVYIRKSIVRVVRSAESVAAVTAKCTFRYKSQRGGPLVATWGRVQKTNSRICGNKLFGGNLKFGDGIKSPI